MVHLRADLSLTERSKNEKKQQQLQIQQQHRKKEKTPANHLPALKRSFCLSIRIILDSFFLISNPLESRVCCLP